MQDVVYWMDSCGNQGDIAEVCDCGCNSDYTGCEEPCSCIPDCSGRKCGDDGCSGSCGDCDSNEDCVDGTCVPCTPDCSDRECGDNGCGGSCGDCDPNEDCVDGTCVGSSVDVFTVDCDVPFVLDPARIQDLDYLTLHFDDMVQQYCILGSFTGPSCLFCRPA